MIDTLILEEFLAGRTRESLYWEYAKEDVDRVLDTLENSR